MEQYYVWWPWLTSKRVAQFVSEFLVNVKFLSPSDQYWSCNELVSKDSVRPWTRSYTLPCETLMFKNWSRPSWHVRQRKRWMWKIWGRWLCELEWKRTLLTMALTSGVCLPACIRATGGHFEYSPWHLLAKALTM